MFRAHLRKSACQLVEVDVYGTFRSPPNKATATFIAGMRTKRHLGGEVT